MPSENNTPWTAVEPDIATITQRYENPIGSLAQAECPAFVLRQAYNPDHCRGLVRRFIAVSYTHLTLPTIYSV